jgi:hypothetical protein
MLSDRANKIKSRALYNSLVTQTQGERDISFDSGHARKMTAINAMCKCLGYSGRGHNNSSSR